MRNSVSYEVLRRSECVYRRMRRFGSKSKVKSANAEDIPSTRAVEHRIASLSRWSGPAYLCSKFEVAKTKRNHVFGIAIINLHVNTEEHTRRGSRETQNLETLNETLFDPGSSIEPPNGPLVNKKPRSYP
jgi:hypothetical protein